MSEPIYCDDSVDGDEAVFGDGILDIADEDIEGSND